MQEDDGSVGAVQGDGGAARRWRRCKEMAALQGDENFHY